MWTDRYKLLVCTVSVLRLHSSKRGEWLYLAKWSYIYCFQVNVQGLSGIILLKSYYHYRYKLLTTSLCKGYHWGWILDRPYRVGLGEHCLQNNHNLYTFKWQLKLLCAFTGHVMDECMGLPKEKQGEVNIFIICHVVLCFVVLTIAAWEMKWTDISVMGVDLPCLGRESQKHVFIANDFSLLLALFYVAQHVTV